MTANFGSPESDGRVPPTGRTGVLNQMRIGLAAIDLSGPEFVVVKSSQVAEVVGLSSDTVTENLRYLSTIPLVVGARGRYRGSEAGRALGLLWSQDQTRARVMLNHLMREHWAAKEALWMLQDGPLPKETLAEHLQEGLPGHPRRGAYLVEWLELALIVHQDPESSLVHAPAPTERVHDIPVSVPDPRQVPEEDDYVMGLSNAALRQLPPTEYIAVLRSFTQMIGQLTSV